MPGILQDLRYAARVLFGSAGFTVVAAVTLALGIGANTAMFSVIRGILLMPLPYAEPDRLARVYEESLPGVPEFPVSPGNFTDYRRDTQAFDGLSAYGRGDLQLGGDRPEQLRGMRITSGFFALARLQASARPRVHDGRRSRRRSQRRRPEPHSLAPTLQRQSQHPRSDRGAFGPAVRRCRRAAVWRSACRWHLSHLSARRHGRRLVASDAALDAAAAAIVCSIT